MSMSMSVYSITVFSSPWEIRRSTSPLRCLDVSIMESLVKRIECLEYLLGSKYGDTEAVNTNDLIGQVSQLQRVVDRQFSAEDLKALISNIDANNLWDELELCNVEGNQELAVSAKRSPSIEERQQVVGSYIDKFQALVGQLDRLASTELPPSRPFANLADLKPQLDDILHKLEAPVQQWQELGVRNAQALRVLLEGVVIRENEQWLEIEDRIRAIERELRAKEVKKRNKKGYE